MRERGIQNALTHDHHFEQAGFRALLREEERVSTLSLFNLQKCFSLPPEKNLVYLYRIFRSFH